VSQTVKQLIQKAEEDQQLRPQTLEEYIGQEEVKEALRIGIEAAKIRQAPIDHILLYGPPGMGKTTIAAVVAHEMGSKLWRTTGPAITSPRDLATIVASLQKGDVFFIDEIHRLSKAAEETLYPAMEDFRLHITLGKGLTAKAIEVPLAPFTMVGATTRAGMLTNPLRDRFGLVFRLGFYTPEEIVRIILRTARIYGTPISEKLAQDIAQRARGIPRIANRLLKRIIDYAVARNQGKVDRKALEETFTLMKLDELGLDEMDRQLLEALANKYGGGPLGIETMAAILGEDRDTVEDVYEPYLIQSGLLERTPRGRVLTNKAKQHLHLETRQSGALFS
jgi:Holliday junction DNA helicase RuvB